ncbi:hypothetical protein TSAR_007438 [Trichomalopsis sarcophagae]|uniref:SCP domain-containing protein n=1 Tax=Trichomalopsis sarcophagae TaxID=543379 RepID=A0A232FEF5_9HYME|nr:hypothetical protein TSAR_007438 [Trichomalopsis sarcophagae]
MKAFNVLTFTFLVFSNFLVVFSNDYDAHAADYCNLNCTSKFDDGVVEPHVLCTFRNPSPAKACTDVQKVGLTEEEKQKVLDVHNKLRQFVASGLETRGSPGPQPLAKNMPILEWDEELAFLAQRAAIQCSREHYCSDAERFPVGQNIAHTGIPSKKYDLEDMVKSWYDEVQYFNAGEVPSFVPRESDSGLPDIEHYTQLVWDQTTKIGCGLIVWRENKMYKTNLYCNYGESGNYESDPVYKTA